MQCETPSLPQRGVTLIECCATLAIASILVGSVVPSFGDLRLRRTLDGVSAELSNDLQFVRSEAVSRNQPMRLSVNQTGGGSCYVLHTGAAGDCTCIGAASAACVGDAQAVKTVFLPAERSVALTSNSPSLLWHPTRGTVSPTGTLRVALSDGREVRHIVNMLGRARTCSPQGRVVGHPAC